MAVNRTDSGLAAAAREGLMAEVTKHQIGQNPALQALVGSIGQQFAGAMAQIQPGAAEARQVASQAPDRGEGRGI